MFQVQVSLQSNAQSDWDRLQATTNGVTVALIVTGHALEDLPVTWALGPAGPAGPAIDTSGDHATGEILGEQQRKAGCTHDINIHQ